MPEQNESTNLEARRKAFEDADASATGYSTSGIVVQETVSTEYTPREMMTLSLGVLGFGLVIILVLAWLVQKREDPDVLLRVFCVPLIILSAVFLIVMGYSQDQITPVIGLLGTLAGYLLGRIDRAPSPPEAQPAQPPQTT